MLKFSFFFLLSVYSIPMFAQETYISTGHYQHVYFNVKNPIIIKTTIPAERWILKTNNGIIEQESGNIFWTPTHPEISFCKLQFFDASIADTSKPVYVQSFKLDFIPLPEIVVHPYDFQSSQPIWSRVEKLYLNFFELPYEAPFLHVDSLVRVISFDAHVYDTRYSIDSVFHFKSAEFTADFKAFLKTCKKWATVRLAHIRVFIPWERPQEFVMDPKKYSEVYHKNFDYQLWE